MRNVQNLTRHDVYEIRAQWDSEVGVLGGRERECARYRKAILTWDAPGTFLPGCVGSSGTRYMPKVLQIPAYH